MESAMQIVNLSHPELENWHDPKTLVVYTTQYVDMAQVQEIRRIFPSLTILGLSSFHGILLHEGFKRGIYALLIEESDDLELRTTAIDLSKTEDIRTCVCNHLQKWTSDHLDARSFFIHAT